MFSCFVNVHDEVDVYACVWFQRVNVTHWGQLDSPVINQAVSAHVKTVWPA